MSISFYALIIVGDCKKTLQGFKTRRDGALCCPRRVSRLQTRFRSASDARQKLLDPEELDVETERAGFRGAPEEAEMAAAPLSDPYPHADLATLGMCDSIRI